MDFTLLRSDRRSVALELSPTRGLLVRGPRRMTEAEARRFVEAHRDWIESRMARMAEAAAKAPAPLTPAEVEALRARAKRELPALVARQAERMGLVPAGLTVTGARTRFGSCSGKNRLSFSCFLMANAPEVIDYVIVHELAHLRCKNHGPAFWALVARYCPDYRALRKQLVMPAAEAAPQSR